MKSLFSRSLFAAFLVVAGYAGSFAQTTVTLPTIACSNCNGPGAFATTAPACTSGLVGAPLTMSWGAATGATSYTILIATDATLTQNVATYTTTGTSVSVPAVGLAPSVTYYWTVIANSAAGSTKATGGPCTFSTNTTWTGGSATGGFPNGSSSQQILGNGITGGYYDCRSGDGTCASGDNMLCNPTFKTIATSTGFVPEWMFMESNLAYVNIVNTALGTDLTAAVGSTPPSGTNTGVKIALKANSVMGYIQPMFERNTSSATVSYKFTFWARTAPSYNLPSMGAGFDTGLFFAGVTGGIVPNTSWTQYNRTLTLAPGASTEFFIVGGADNGNGSLVYITDAILCKL